MGQVSARQSLVRNRFGNRMDRTGAIRQMRRPDHLRLVSVQSMLNFSLAANTRFILSSWADTFSTLRPVVVQTKTLLSPQQLLISITISAAMSLWLEIVRLRLAVQPELSKLTQLEASLLPVMSKAQPVLIVKFSSLGVWLMLSSPMNSSEPSAESSLKARTVPLGRGMPILLEAELEISILLAALRSVWVWPPALRLMKLYLRILMPQTLGMNSTCFCDFSSRVTGSLRVQRWKSENDFSEKEGAASSLDLIIVIAIAIGWKFSFLLETVLTSPAMSLSLALSYFLPLQLSMVTHPPTSALVSSALTITVQSAFQEKPVVRQATSHSVVTAASLKTFQLRVGRVLKPAGREGKLIPSMLLKTSMPQRVLRMQPLLQPRRVPLTRVEVCPTLAQTWMFLSMYFWRMDSVLIRLASQFCQKTLMLSGLVTALKVTVSVWMLEETSVKQSSLLPWSNWMDLTSLMMANWLLQTVTAKLTAPLISLPCATPTTASTTIRLRYCLLI